MTAKKENGVKNGPTVAETTYTKGQIISSKKYAHRRDLVGALLDDNHTYTLAQADGMIEKFMKRKVT